MFIVVWSLGDHILFAVEGPLGLHLAVEGGEGRRLGQIGGARNVGVIFGVGAVYLLARYGRVGYPVFYALAAACALVAGQFYWRLKVGHAAPPSRRFVWKRRYYRLFYAISALFGVRKQIFLAFGGWVLVSLHGVPVSTIALLYVIAAGIGVVLRPLLGDVIDWVGERAVLATDELLLLAICMVYAFVQDVAPAVRRLRAGQRAVRAAHRAHHLPEEDRRGPVRHHADDRRRHHDRPRGGDEPAGAVGLVCGSATATSGSSCWPGRSRSAGFFVCLRIRTPARPGAPRTAGAPA